MWWDLMKVLFITLSIFFFGCKGFMCRSAVNDRGNSNPFACPSLCYGPNCSSKSIETLQSKDETSNLIGCNGDGFLLLDRDKTTTFYEERHVIYTVTENSQIYLVLSENATSQFVPSTNLVYNFILLSVPTAATTWLILYNDSNAKYNFYASEDSTVVNYETGEKVSSVPLSISLKTVTGFPYDPVQIQKRVCDVFEWKHKASSLTSLLNIGDANSVRLFLQKSVKTDTRAVCDTSKSKSGFNGYTDNIRTALLSSLPIASSCTEKSENGMSSVYVLDILNHTENTTIQFEVMEAPVNSKPTVVVLRSSKPVTWLVNGNALKLCNINFLVSTNSNVTWNHDLPSPFVTSKVFPKQDGDFLHELSTFFNLPITYTKFIGNPTVVRLTLNGGEGKKTQERPAKPSDTFFAKLHANFRIDSRVDSDLFVECKLLKEYYVAASDLIVGNHCLPLSFNDGILFRNLTSCGLLRESLNSFKIKVSVGNYEKEIFFQIPEKPSSQISVYKDIHMKTKASAVQTLDKTSSTFYAKVRLSAFEKHNISSKLNQCYIVDENDSFRLDLIQNNCPVNKYTSVLPRRRSEKDIIEFTVSFDLVLESEHYGLYNLVCILSRCFKPHPDLKAPSTLPLCPATSSGRCALDSNLTFGPFCESLNWTFNVTNTPAAHSDLVWVLVVILAAFVAILFLLLALNYRKVEQVASCKHKRSSVNTTYPYLNSDKNEIMRRNGSDEAIQLDQYHSAPLVTHDYENEKGSSESRLHDSKVPHHHHDLGMIKSLSMPLLPSCRKDFVPGSLADEDSGAAEKDSSNNSFEKFRIVERRYLVNAQRSDVVI